MAIQFFNEKISFPFTDKAKYKKWIAAVIIAEGKTGGGISYIFCNDAYLLQLNKKYLKHSTLTDIITFDHSESYPNLPQGKKLIQGDIFISLERIKENASKYKSTFKNELSRVIVHGVLHLLGYKDKTEKDKKRMRGKEEEYIKLLIA